MGTGLQVAVGALLVSVVAACASASDVPVAAAPDELLDEGTSIDAAGSAASDGDPCVLDDEQVASAPQEFLPEGMSRSFITIDEQAELTEDLAEGEDLRICRYSGTVGSDVALMIDVVTYGDPASWQEMFDSVQKLPNAAEFDHGGTTIRYGGDQAFADVHGVEYGVFWWQEASAADWGSSSARILQQLHENG